MQLHKATLTAIRHATPDQLLEMDPKDMDEEELRGYHERVGPVKKRAAELSRTTAVPEDFKTEEAFPVYANPKKIERKIHDALNLFRSRKNREFFRLPVDSAVAMIQTLLGRES